MWGEGMGPFLPSPGTFMAQEGSKVELFWSQNRTIMAGLLRGGAPTGNRFMSHITSNYMAQHDLGPFLPSPGTLGAGRVQNIAILGSKSKDYGRLCPERGIPFGKCLVRHIIS